MKVRIGLLLIYLFCLNDSSSYVYGPGIYKMLLRVLRTYGRICPKGQILASRGSAEAGLKSTHNLCFEFHLKIVIYRQKKRSE